MQLPAQLAHISHAQRQNRTGCHADPPGGAKGKARICQIIRADPRQNIPRLWPHQRQHGRPGCHIHQFRPCPGGDVARNPVEIMGGKAGAGDDVEFVARHPCHSHIRLDAALVVEHLRIGQAAHGAVDIAGGDPVQGRCRIRPLQGEFRERGLVDQHRRLARGLMLAPHRVPPAGALIAVAVLRHLARRQIGKPVWPFPAQLFAETGPSRLQMGIKRRAARGPGRAVLFRRPGDGVMFAIGFQRAFPYPVGRLMHLAEAADVYRPKVERGRALGHPFRQRHARPPARGDAKGVEPGPDEQVPLFRRLAQDEVAIRREAFRPVDQLLDPGGFQRWHPADGQVHELPEMIEVRGQKLEVEPFGDSLHRPGHRVRLVPAPDKPADLFLPVGQPVGVAQGGQVRRHAGDPFSHHVLMFHRHQRHVDAHRRRQGTRPLPGADHHLFAVYPALRRLHPPDAPLFHDDPGNRRILKYPHPRHARAACQRLGDIRRVCLPVGRQKGRAHQIVYGHQRPQVLRLLRGQQMHLKPEGMRGR